MVFPSQSAFIRRAANHHVKAKWKTFSTSSSRREEAQIGRVEGRKIIAQGKRTLAEPLRPRRNTAARSFRGDLAGFVVTAVS